MASGGGPVSLGSGDAGASALVGGETGFLLSGLWTHHP